MDKIDNSEIKRRLSLPLSEKIAWAKSVIVEYWCQYEGQVYVSYSGGKDSDVLRHLVHSVFPTVPLVFCDTGLEYPEIRTHVKLLGDVVTWMKPKMKFPDVLKTFGVAVASKEVAQKIGEILTTKSDKLRNKRLFGDEKGNGKLPEKWKPLLDAPFKISGKCCHIFKKEPFARYERLTRRKPFSGTRIEESRLRFFSYQTTGCNSFGDKPKSLPLSIWTEKDIWDYAQMHNIRFAEVYYDRQVNGVLAEKLDRTGCMFCMFGIEQSPKGKPNRIQKMAMTHPRQYAYLINETMIPKVLDFIGVNYKPLS